METIGSDPALDPITHACTPVSRLHVVVHGLSGRLLEEYACDQRDMNARNACEGIHTVDMTYKSQRAAKTGAVDRTTAVHDLFFGIVSVCEETGAWGRTAPLPLHKDDSASGSTGEEVYVGSTTLPLRSLQAYGVEMLPSRQPVGAMSRLSFPFRLVLLQHTPERSITPSGCHRVTIVAVENMLSNPDIASLELMAEGSLALTRDDGAVLPEYRAVLNICERLFPLSFTPVSRQFPFLSMLHPFPPDELQSRQREALLHPKAASSDKLQTAFSNPGPLLSFTFYATDPRYPFDYKTWWQQLPPATQKVMHMLEDEASATNQTSAIPLHRRTTVFDVTAIQPVPMGGCTWGEEYLPTPAPLMKRIVEKQRKRKKGAGPVSSLDSQSAVGGSSFSSPPRGAFENNVPDLSEWCVRPLRMVAPIVTQAANSDLTQHCWNCVVNLTGVGKCAIAVSVEVPVMAVDAKDSCTGSIPRLHRVHGTILIVPDMLRHSTSGLLHLPVRCEVPESLGLNTSSLWVILAVQYLFVFPFNHAENNLCVVRSRQSYDRLTLKTLVGHRGLGKTYTRGRHKGQTAKLAENSVESLNAAHRRGCEMVEFDVMLTLDRVPIIFHDPFLQLQARERRNTSRFLQELTERERHSLHTNGMSTIPYNSSLNDSLPTALDANAPTTTLSRAHGDCDDGAYLEAGLSQTPFSRFSQWLAQESNTYASVQVPVHRLTKRQLDVMVTETFAFGRESLTLKTLILRHWDQIRRVYRNRSRLESMQANSILIKPEDKNEFRGCNDIVRSPSAPTGAPFQTARPATVGGDAPLTYGHGYEDHPFASAFTLQEYRQQYRRDRRMLDRQEDITNRIATLEELFCLTPATLRLDLEVKYPIQPKLDDQLYLQTDAFEVNGYVDAILEVVFRYAEEGREVTFCSFDPDICLALSMKQSRYDIIFLGDTEERTDLKDYRSFYIEGAMQFAELHYLSGISIGAATLCMQGQKVIPSIRTETLSRRLRHLSLVSDAAVQKLIDEEDAYSVGSEDAAVMTFWKAFTDGHGRGLVAEAHRRGLKLWTWGEQNSDFYFCFLQVSRMGVDAVISDNIPLWSKAAVETLDDSGDVASGELCAHGAESMVSLQHGARFGRNVMPEPAGTSCHT